MATNPPNPDQPRDTVPVWVPQEGGQIVHTIDGGVSRVHEVVDHIVEVLRDHLPHFVLHTPGARVYDPDAAAAPGSGPPPDQARDQAPDQAPAETAASAPPTLPTVTSSTRTRPAPSTPDDETNPPGV